MNLQKAAKEYADKHPENDFDYERKITQQDFEAGGNYVLGEIKKTEVDFDPATTAWISESHEVQYNKPTDVELDSEEWADFVSVDEAKAVIYFKDQRIAELEKKYAEAVKVIKFYGEPNNWISSNDSDDATICNEDISEVEKVISRMTFTGPVSFNISITNGGKRARQFLKEHL